MATYFIEECKERIALYSKLLMATIGVLIFSVSGMVNMMAGQSNPPLLGVTFSMLEAGVALCILCATAIGCLWREIFKQINRLGRVNQ